MKKLLEKCKNKKTLVAVLGILGILLTTIGVTVAWFSYSRNGIKENSITSGKITFIYEENDTVGNGILLEDAMPMPDSYGKTQDNHFDFKVTSTSGSAKIPYEITLRKTENSDNLDEYVKVYLTKINGSSEEEKVLEMYDDLDNSTNQIAVLNNEKTLYEAEVPAGAKNYTDNYRLRIWLNDNESDGSVLSYQQTVRQECTDTTYTEEETCKSAGERWIDVAEPASSKNFVVKVNVYAEGEAASSEEIADANSTGIEEISIGSTTAISNTDPNENYDYSITTSNSNITLDIETENPNATVDVVPYTPPTAMNTKVQRLSASKELTLTNGDNYFKVTIRSANKQKLKEYILKVIKTVGHDASLESLTFDNCTLNETFSNDNFTYTCDATSESLVFTGQATDSSATVVVTGNNAITECGTAVTVTVTAEDGETTQTYTVTATYQGDFTYTNVTGDSILSILKDNDLSEGYYDFKINGKEDHYKVHLYTFNGNQTWDTDRQFGTASDVANSCGGMAKHMVAVKVNGNLTNSAKIEPFYTEYGGPKGFTLYVTGTLTNTGIIDNSHGAYAYGEDVYLWKNDTNDYEVVPAEGGTGGARLTNNDPSIKEGYNNGNPGQAGSLIAKRATGGGGSGALYKYSGENISGKGETGTSYSGGSGGGGAYKKVAKDASKNGGSGGNGNSGGGGAGNPGGSSSGANGTGGLLIIYANEYSNDGVISATGTTGASAGAYGGSSGGGSINIFINHAFEYDPMEIDIDEFYNEILGTTSVVGKSTTTSNNGGTGGAGTVNIGKFRNGQYCDLKNCLSAEKTDAENSIQSKSGDSILSILNDNSLNSGYYNFLVNNKTYPVHLIVLNGNQTIIEDTRYGNITVDCATGTETNQMAKRMVIVKVNGNLTINNEVTIGPKYNEQYGGPKGFLLYVTGTLTNNGTIDNSHGAYAYGEDVYLWKNGEDDYEFIPAEGGLGGEAFSVALKSSGKAGNPGQNGVDSNKARATGGGGTGAAAFGDSGKYTVNIKDGAAGTSYSGGSGGGGVDVNRSSNATGYDTPTDGGAGGQGYGYRQNSNWTARKGGGGAGNPGGIGGLNGNTSTDYAGENGTGGLLIIFSNTLENNGSITANGYSGNASGRAGGGSSGGGSINIFYTGAFTDTTNNINADGGIAVGQYLGGAGGNGTITYTQISTNTVTPSLNNSNPSEPSNLSANQLNTAQNVIAGSALLAAINSN